MVIAAKSDMLAPANVASVRSLRMMMGQNQRATNKDINAYTTYQLHENCVMPK